MSNGLKKKEKSGIVATIFKKLVPFAIPILAFSVFTNLLRLTVPLYMLQVIDRVMSSESVETLVSISIVAFIALLASALLANAISQTQMTIGAWLDETLFSRVASASMKPRIHNNQYLSSRMMRELGQLRQFFASPTIMCLLEVPWSILFIAILFWLHFYLGAVATVAFGALLFTSIIGELLTQKRVADGQREKEKGMAALAAAAESSEAVATMGISGRLIDRLNTNNLNASSKLIGGMRWTIQVQQLNKFLRTCAQIAILGVGALLVLQAEVTMGTMIAGSILLGLALSPVDKAIGSFRSIRGALDSVAFLDTQLSLSNERGITTTFTLEGGCSLSLRQAMFMPPGARRPVLRPLSLEIPAGRSVGIIGPVGSGKSTLCRMLVGAIPPTSGSVRVNDVEISRVVGESFGAHVGYLPQNEPPLPATIEENISRFATGEDVETKRAVVEAARLAGVNEAIMNLHQKYETRIGAGGFEALSSGQIQQVLIARTFYNNPSLIVMDEPATSLDKTSEEYLADAISKAKKRGATIFFVTQRQSLLNKCDTLIYLRDGNLVTVGAREQVLREIAKGDISPGPRKIAENEAKRRIQPKATS